MSERSGLFGAKSDRAACLGAKGADPPAAKVLKRLEAVAARLHSVGKASVEELVQTAMEVIEMSERLEKYYAQEQLEEIELRRHKLGEEGIRAAEEEWTKLIEEVRAEMKAGTDPESERVQRLASRWMELVRGFTGGNPGIERSLSNMWQQEETIHGMDTRQMREMTKYISKATAAPNE